MHVSQYILHNIKNKHKNYMILLIVAEKAELIKYLYIIPKSIYCLEVNLIRTLCGIEFRGLIYSVIEKRNRSKTKQMRLYKYKNHFY